ncbi:hypothetical protein Sjap_014483 [Stephania japonica]|uniref:Uncharacterized protein n=1 Tax=Stephania japonica TaxID=461633 RepID=A0AAP0IHD1_9MAGN
MISISMLVAAPLRAEPARKTTPPNNIDSFRPKIRVIEAAKKEATNAATYREEVKDVNNWLSNLQY